MAISAIISLNYRNMPWGPSLEIDLLKHMEILSVNYTVHQKPPFYYEYVNNNNLYYYNTRQCDTLPLNWTRIKMTDKCLRNNLSEQLNSVPHIVSSRYTYTAYFDSYLQLNDAFRIVILTNVKLKICKTNIFDRYCLITFRSSPTKVTVIATRIPTEYRWFMIAAPVLIKVSSLYGPCHYLSTKLIYWQCVLLYCIPMWIYCINFFWNHETQL